MVTSNNDFEQQLLGKFDNMRNELKSLNDRLTVFEGETKTAFSELSGRIKGNQELIIKDFSNYVEKDVCTSHRESQGVRLGHLEERMKIIEYRFSEFIKEKDRKDALTSNAIVAWLPDLLKTIAIVGGGIFVAIKVFS